MPRLDIEAEVARLAELPPAALREEWERVTASEVVPRISPSMLRLAMAWELQARGFGGLSRRTRQKLEQLGAGRTVTREVSAGTRLVREWGGKLHVVEIGEDQAISWDGRSWRSLSEVARAITGTRWSGPAFFGLKQQKKAAA